MLTAHCGGVYRTSDRHGPRSRARGRSGIRSRPLRGGRVRTSIDQVSPCPWCVHFRLKAADAVIVRQKAPLVPNNSEYVSHKVLQALLSQGRFAATEKSKKSGTSCEYAGKFEHLGCSGPCAPSRSSSSTLQTCVERRPAGNRHPCPEHDRASNAVPNHRKKHHSACLRGTRGKPLELQISRPASRVSDCSELREVDADAVIT